VLATVLARADVVAQLFVCEISGTPDVFLQTGHGTSARAYVGFVRANVAEYDTTEVRYSSRGKSVIQSES
jgi:hypothetical protein